MKKSSQFFFHSGDENRKICGNAKIECYLETGSDFQIFKDKFNRQCNCLPACTFVEYEAKIERAKLNMMINRPGWESQKNDQGYSCAFKRPFSLYQ